MEPKDTPHKISVSAEVYEQLDGLRKTNKGEVSFSDAIAWLLEEARKHGVKTG